jgi:hypothetical protein
VAIRRAGTRQVESLRSIGKCAHVVRREDDGPAKIGPRAFRRNLLRLFLREQCAGRVREKQEQSCGQAKIFH